MKIPLTNLGLTLVLAAAALAAPPQPVTDLSITVVDSAHVQLDWSPVTADTSGNPLDCVVYDLHKGTEAVFTPGPTTWLDSTSTTSYTDSLAGEMAFYRVQVQSCNTTYPHDMVRVPAGTFMMGQAGIAEPVHQVTLTHDFLLGRTEVTNAEYLQALNWAIQQELVIINSSAAYMNSKELIRFDNYPGYTDQSEIKYNQDTGLCYLHQGTFGNGATYGWSNPWGPGDAYPNGYDPATQPVKFVTWYGAIAYCDWRSQMENLTPYYLGIPSNPNPYDAVGYRLPTEAEWEFAARYSDERMYPWGNEPPTCTLANYSSYSWNFCVPWTASVGSFPAGESSLGLLDMAGNVSEWCNDFYGPYEQGPTINPSGYNLPIAYRPLRGGSYFNPNNVESTTRLSGHSEQWGDGIGFRFCRILN